MTMNGISANLNLPVSSLNATNTSAEVTEVKNLANKLTVKEYTLNYFSDVPILAEVARCESRFRQEDENGEVLRGEQNSLDRGVMQINELYHLKRSRDLGLDILTLRGNLSYARHLFEKEGLQPWSASKPCWGKTTAYAEYSALAVK